MSSPTSSPASEHTLLDPGEQLNAVDPNEDVPHGGGGVAVLGGVGDLAAGGGGGVTQQIQFWENKYRCILNHTLCISIRFHHTFL